MKYIVERWVEEEDKEMKEKVEAIKEQKEVKDEKEARRVAEEWKKLKDTKRVTLHYCFHDLPEPKPCKRIVLK